MANQETYRIYGKHQDDKRFSALGSDGLIGSGNLIYAYFFTVGDLDGKGNEITIESIDKDVENLNNDNPEFTFEKRKVA